MRRFLTLVLPILLTGTASALADDRAMALETVQKAIKAHGGDAALARARLCNRKLRGTLTLDKPYAFTAEFIEDLPNRWRGTFELTSATQKLSMVLVRDGDKGWRSSAGMIAELTKEEIDDLKEDSFVWWLATLVPLNSEDVNLAPLPESTMEGKSAVGLKVSSKGHEDVKLFFDKATHWLVAAQRRGNVAGQAVDKEYRFRDHKNIDGAVLPTRYVELTNKKTFVEVTAVTYQFPKRLEDNLFAKP